MALTSRVDDELKKVREQKRELKKRERELKEERALEKGMVKWKNIMDAKAACEKIIEATDLGMKMTLTQLDKFPTFYIYQHPYYKKLKTSNRNDEWVKEYLGEIKMGPKGGRTGVEADLLESARKSTLAAWKRANKKKKKVRVGVMTFTPPGESKPEKTKTLPQRGDSGKAMAARNVGVG